MAKGAYGKEKKGMDMKNPTNMKTNAGKAAPKKK